MFLVHSYACGEQASFPGPLGRRDVCPHCGVELRCCLQCRLYEPGSSAECREPQAEVPRDRDRGNFCDFFVPSKSARAGRGDADGARAAFDALFKKG